jgi:Zn-dependent protease with chaperone function
MSKAIVSGRVVAALGACGLVAGCLSTGNFVQRQTTQTYETVPAKFIEIAQQRRLVGNPPGAEPQNLAETNLTLDRRQLPGGKPLKDYADEILAKLVANYPHAKPPMWTVVTVSSSLVPQTYPGGAIEIPQGVFMNAESEDELAFMLAHEASHLILNHAAQGEDEEKWKAVRALGFEGAATMGGILAGKKGSGGSETLQWVAASYLATDYIDEGILNPSWRRTQEEEADLLGLDLMVRAGYNRNTALFVFQRLKNRAERQGDEERLARAEIDKAIGDKFAKGELKDGFEEMQVQFFKLPQEAIKRIVADLGKSHASDEDRGQHLSAYMTREYSRERMPLRIETRRYKERVFSGPALASLRRQVFLDRAESLITGNRPGEAVTLLVQLLKDAKDTNPEIRLKLHRAHLANGNRAEATASLALAALDPEAPEEVYAKLLATYRDDREPVKALGVLDAYEKRYPRQRTRSLPLRIELLKEAKRDGEARQVLRRCQQETRDRELIGRCVTAMEA